jgi:hypothetical protein
MNDEIIEIGLVKAKWTSDSYLERLALLDGLILALNKDDLQNYDKRNTLSDKLSYRKHYQEQIYKSRLSEMGFLNTCKSILEENRQDIHKITDLKVGYYTKDGKGSIDENVINRILDDANFKSASYESQLQILGDEIERCADFIEKEGALCAFLEKEMNSELVRLNPSKKGLLQLFSKESTAQKLMKGIEHQQELVKECRSELASLDTTYKLLISDGKDVVEKMFDKYAALSEQDKSNSKITNEIIKEINLFLDTQQEHIVHLEKSIVEKKGLIEKQDFILLQKEQELLDLENNFLGKDKNQTPQENNISKINMMSFDKTKMTVPINNRRDEIKDKNKNIEQSSIIITNRIKDNSKRRNRGKGM